jgi:hypothetical protein
MDGARILRQLRGLCSDIDRGRSPRRIDWKRALVVAALPLAIGLGAGAAGCRLATPADDPPPSHVIQVPDPDLYGAPEYAAPMEPRPGLADGVKPWTGPGDLDLPVAAYAVPHDDQPGVSPDVDPGGSTRYGAPFPR